MDIQRQEETNILINHNQKVELKTNDQQGEEKINDNYSNNINIAFSATPEKKKDLLDQDASHSNSGDSKSQKRKRKSSTNSNSSSDSNEGNENKPIQATDFFLPSQLESEYHKMIEEEMLQEQKKSAILQNQSISQLLSLMQFNNIKIETIGNKADMERLKNDILLKLQIKQAQEQDQKQEKNQDGSSNITQLDTSKQQNQVMPEFEFIREDDAELKITEYAEEGVQYLELGENREALIRLKKSDNIIQSCIAVGIEVKQSLMLCVLINLGVCYYNIGLLEESLISLENCLVTIKSEKFDQAPDIDLSKSAIEDECGFQQLLRKLQYKKIQCQLHMQCCIILSEMKRHEDSLIHSRFAIKISQKVLTQIMYVCYVMLIEQTTECDPSEPSSNDNNKHFSLQYLLEVANAIISDGGVCKLQPESEIHINPKFNEIVSKSIHRMFADNESKSRKKVKTVTREEVDQKEQIIEDQKEEQDYLLKLVTLLLHSHEIMQQNTEILYGSDKDLQQKKASKQDAILKMFGALLRKKAQTQKCKQDILIEEPAAEIGFLFTGISYQSRLCCSSILSLLQLRPFCLEELQRGVIDPFEIVSAHSVLQSITNLVISLYCASTEMRFLEEEAFIPYINNYRILESEAFLAKSLEIAYTYFSHDVAFVQQIISIYQRFHNTMKSPIHEDESIPPDRYKMLKQLSGAVKNKTFIPVIRVPHQISDDAKNDDFKDQTEASVQIINDLSLNINEQEPKSPSQILFIKTEVEEEQVQTIKQQALQVQESNEVLNQCKHIESPQLEEQITNINNNEMTSQNTVEQVEKNSNHEFLKAKNAELTCIPTIMQLNTVLHPTIKNNVIINNSTKSISKQSNLVSNAITNAALYTKKIRPRYMQIPVFIPLKSVSKYGKENLSKTQTLMRPKTQSDSNCNQQTVIKDNKFQVRGFSSQQQRRNKSNLQNGRKSEIASMTASQLQPQRSASFNAHSTSNNVFRISNLKHKKATFNSKSGQGHDDSKTITMQKYSQNLQEKLVATPQLNKPQARKYQNNSLLKSIIDQKKQMSVQAGIFIDPLQTASNNSIQQQQQQQQQQLQGLSKLQKLNIFSHKGLAKFMESAQQVPVFKKNPNSVNNFFKIYKSSDVNLKICGNVFQPSKLQPQNLQIYKIKDAPQQKLKMNQDELLGQIYKQHNRSNQTMQQQFAKKYVMISPYATALPKQQKQINQIIK